MNTSDNGQAATGEHKKNRFTQAQFYQLCKWMTSQKNRLVDERPTKEVAAQQAYAALRFPVTKSNIDGASEATGVAWYAKLDRANTNKSLMVRQARDTQIAVIDAAIRNLYEKLGEELPEGYLAGVLSNKLPKEPAVAPKVGDVRPVGQPVPPTYGSEIGRPK